MILGIDLGTSISGFCLMLSKKKTAGKWYTTYSITLNKKLSHMEKFDEIVSYFHRNCIGGNSNTIELAVIEHPVVRGHGKVLLELMGIIKYLLYQRGIPFICVPPSTLKKFATGAGVAGKSIMVKKALQEFGVDVETEDEVDAFWLAYFGRVFNNGIDKTDPKYRVQVMDGFKKKIKNKR